MKKFCLFFILIFLFSSLAACQKREDKKPEGQTRNDLESESSSSETPEESEPLAEIKYDLTGYWTLDLEKTSSKNSKGLQLTFGTGISYGYEMVIREDGYFSFYVALGVGGEGSYIVANNAVTAKFYNIPREETFEYVMNIEDDNGLINLVMYMFDMDYTLVWVKDDSKSIQANSSSNSQNTISPLDYIGESMFSVMKEYGSGFYVEYYTGSYSLYYYNLDVQFGGIEEGHQHSIDVFKYDTVRFLVFNENAKINDKLRANMTYSELKNAMSGIVDVPSLQYGEMDDNYSTNFFFDGFCYVYYFNSPSSISSYVFVEKG